MSIQDDIITRQNFDEPGNVKYNQILIPKHMLKELLESEKQKDTRKYQRCYKKLNANNINLALQELTKNGFKVAKPESMIKGQKVMLPSRPNYPI